MEALSQEEPLSRKEPDHQKGHAMHEPGSGWGGVAEISGRSGRTCSGSSLEDS